MIDDAPLLPPLSVIRDRLTRNQRERWLLRALYRLILDGSPIFSLTSRGADMLKVDLDAAGIPYRDVSGLVFEFHALRCQCATLADGAGVSPRVAKNS